MRLICTIDTASSREDPHAFSAYLTHQGIENQKEPLSAHTFRIWVYDEDAVPKAQALYAQYQSDPHQKEYQERLFAPPVAPPAAQTQLVHTEEGETPPLAVRVRRRRLLSPDPYGPLSLCVLLLSCFLFFWAQMGKGISLPPQIPGVVTAPMMAPVEKALAYDYPSYFQLRDEFFLLYPPQDIEEKVAPSAEAEQLLTQLRQEKTWMGFYDRLLLSMRVPGAAASSSRPSFERIREGEYWRLFTPSLLHFDFLHILFNVLWFILLGNQIEFRIGWWRYLLLLITTGVFSNSAQYLVSGPFFIGLSGIVCGLAAFIWARQQVAPWEGYLLQRFTLLFLAVFVFGMFALQLIFFFLQLLGKMEAPIGIANTAHLVGALVGYLLGRLRFFAAHPVGIRDK